MSPVWRRVRVRRRAEAVARASRVVRIIGSRSCVRRLVKAGKISLTSLKKQG